MRKWSVVRRTGTAGELHGRPIEPDGVRLVEVLEVVAPALVLGSTQPESDVDAAAVRMLRLEVARRRSGGGGVLLVPGRSAWIDVTIGRDDRLWLDDVGMAFHWLGHAWSRAVHELGVEGTVHVGPIRETAWSRRVCFAGVGSGEVLVGERKLVGISQRRTRDGARFQCIVHRRWDPVPLLGLLALDDDERAAGVLELEGVATGLDVPLDDLVRSLVASLP